jgi:hypothetical protein
MIDVMFELPSSGENEITITEEYAKSKVEKINLHRLKAA